MAFQLKEFFWKLVGGVYNAAPAASVEAKSRALQVDAAGNLLVGLGGVGGTVAHDAADAGSPIKVGGIASALAAAVVTALDRVNASFDLRGRLRVIPAGEESSITAVHEPAANTKATILVAAGGAGVKHVVTGLSASLGSDGAVTVARLKVNLIEDAAGTPVIKWAGNLSVIATAGGSAQYVTPAGFCVHLTANKSVTWEFTAAGGANTYEAVSMQYHTLPA